MSVKNVKVQIARFLESKTASVLCIQGNWGTGKTYNWNESLQEAADNQKIGRDKYAYVSLFGLNTIADLKQEIIHQTIDVNQIGKPFDFNDVASYVKHAFPSILKLGSWTGKLLGDNYTSAGVAVMYMLVRKRLVCIDDLERKGKDLRSADVLGLVSQLREDRDCKVIILLNDERLEGEDRAEFERYLEKVVDVNLRFDPSAKDCAQIALKTLDGPDDLKQQVSEWTTKLGIDNVRVIRKIYSFVRQIEPHLTEYKSGVFKSVSHTIVLMAWCHLQPEIAPNKSFLVRRGAYYMFGASNEVDNLTNQEREWHNLIADYGYSHTDEFDIALLRGIEDGYFSKEIIDKHAIELNQRVETDLAAQQLKKVWSEFRDTFDDDLDRQLKGFEHCFTENAKYYSLNDTVSVVNLFRDLGRKDDGDRILNLYCEALQGVSGAYDFADLALFGHTLDDDIKEKLSAMDQRQKTTEPVEKLFLMLADDGYNTEITVPLAGLPVDEYVRVLKGHEGRELFQIRRGLTQYNRLANPSVHTVEIMRKANDALQQIAAENFVNNYRTSRWGIAERLAEIEQQEISPAIGEES